MSWGSKANAKSSPMHWYRLRAGFAATKKSFAAPDPGSWWKIRWNQEPAASPCEKGDQPHAILAGKLASGWGKRVLWYCCWSNMSGFSLPVQESHWHVGASAVEVWKKTRLILKKIRLQGGLVHVHSFPKRGCSKHEAVSNHCSDVCSILDICKSRESKQGTLKAPFNHFIFYNFCTSFSL